LRLLKEMCVSGERGRGAAFGVVVFDVDGFDVEGLGFGVAPAGGGGGRADMARWVFVDGFFSSSRFLIFLAGGFGAETSRKGYCRCLPVGG
jgi:hypothetical protein